MKLKFHLILSALILSQITSASADNNTLQPRLILNGQTGSYSYSQAESQRGRIVFKSPH